MFSKAILIGNLGRDAEVRFVPDGTPLAKMRLAVGRQVKKDGKKTEVTDWWEVEVWGALADYCGRQGTKGRQAFVEGRMVFETWQDKQTGQTRETKKVIADSVRFLGGGSGAGRPAAPRATEPPRDRGETAPDGTPIVDGPDQSAPAAPEEFEAPEHTPSSGFQVLQRDRRNGG